MVIVAIIKISKRVKRGGIIGCFMRNNKDKLFKGWILGYNKEHFVFKIALKYTGV